MSWSKMMKGFIVEAKLADSGQSKMFARADGKVSQAPKQVRQMKPIVHNTAALMRGESKVISPYVNKQVAKGSNLKRSMGV